MQHFLIENNLDSEKVVIDDKILLHQMIKVLRFSRGDELVLINGKGIKAKSVIGEISNKFAVINIIYKKMYEKPARNLRLYIGVMKKPAVMELIFQKAVELGVTDIIPFISKRCQINDLRKENRLSFIIKEACEQSERPFLPMLHDPVKFENFKNNLPDGKILAGDARDFDKRLFEIPFSKNEDVNLLIGPEGGFTDDELRELRCVKAVIFGLGENILRTETAAIAALSLIQFSC